MKKSEVREILKKNIDKFHNVKINRDNLDDEPIYCIPFDLGQRLLVFQFIYDFEPDGYMIVRIKDITSVRSGENERFTQQILNEEGILNQIKKPMIVNIDSWETVLRELMDFEKNIIVECESVDNRGFYIGEIIEVNTHSLELLYFNGLGEWDKEPTEINFKDITSVSFDTRYLKIISKYLKPFNDVTNPK